MESPIKIPTEKSFIENPDAMAPSRSSMSSVSNNSQTKGVQSAQIPLAHSTPPIPPLHSTQSTIRQTQRPITSSSQATIAQPNNPNATNADGLPIQKATPPQKPKPKIKQIDKYTLNVNDLIVNITIALKEGDFVPEYNLAISNIGEITKVVLEKIKDEFIRKIQIGKIDLSKSADFDDIKKQFSDEISLLIKKYFPHIDDRTCSVLINHLIQENVGLGRLDLLLRDPNLEEITVNNSKEPVWVYHRKHKWLKTNIYVPTEDRIRHYSTMIGREIGKEITILEPLMDAHLLTGDRVNATLFPITSLGNTITIRKFSEKPWTITDFINAKTIEYETAAVLWLAIENELSVLVAGGTGSGKTSMLNVISNFFPPNQRIISIEDTREITLPKNIHWVPMETRLANPEGKGEITMLDLVVNSLRMRPDRILVGEIRRKKEAEVLFEAMHTGHSVYATIHANNAEETVSRLTHPPIDIPKMMISAVSLICVQYRNRRSGLRRTLQIAEVTEDGNPSVIYQHNVNTDKMVKVGEPRRLLSTLNLYTGLSSQQIRADIQEKIEILKWMVSKKISDINDVGLIISKYYQRKYLSDYK